MISGLILAGGQGRRLQGKDKGLIEIAGRPMIEHVIERFLPQVERLAISANRNLPRYRDYGHDVLVDTHADYPGPLAGLLAGLDWCAHQALAIVPCDCPALPLDLVSRLQRARRAAGADIAYAVAASRPQPVFAVVAKRLTPSLEAFLARGDRKILGWYREHAVTEVDFGDAELPFLNVNTEAERRQLESALQ